MVTKGKKKEVHLGEVAYDVAPTLIAFGKYIEQKRLHIIVKGLVVQEQLGKETQILAIYFTLLTIN